LRKARSFLVVSYLWMRLSLPADTLAAERRLGAGKTGRQTLLILQQQPPEHTGRLAGS